MALDHLTNALQHTHLEPEHRLFDPPERQSWLRNTFNEIPRYLFRSSTPYSDGTTDDTWVRSKDAVRSHPMASIDCFARTDQRAVAAELGKHLWWRYEYRIDNFISWTSSLLFAIQYIIYRHNDVRSGKPALNAIELCVIDTTQFPPGVFVRDMDIMKAYRRFDPELEGMYNMRRNKYYFGEYLSQGSLKIEGNCQIVSAAVLKDAGLFCLRPEWTDRHIENETGWALIVDDMQAAFGRGAYKLNDEECNAAVNVAHLFSNEWRLAVTANCLALRPRSSGDENLIWVLKRLHVGSKSVLLPLWTMAEFPESQKDECNPLRTRIATTDLLPEVKQFKAVYDLFWTEACFENLKESLRDAELAMRRSTMSFLHLKKTDSNRGSSPMQTYREESKKKVEEMVFLAEQLRQTAGDIM